jgi:branched-chain amino acid transport system permease protein
VLVVAVGVAFAALFILPLLGLPPYLITVLTEVFIYAVFAMSLDLLLGYTGLPSLGHAAFWGLGAYGAAIAAGRVVPSFVLALSVGLVAAGLGALLIGAVSIRTSGVYFLMLTLALSQIVYAAAFKWTFLTGGSNGLPAPHLGVPGADLLGRGAPLYYTTLVVFGGSLLVLRRLVGSPLGRTLVGIRENEARMRALGYATVRYKLAAFVVAGLFAGLAGVLYVAYSGYVSPSDVYWTSSGLVLIMVIVGGAGTLLGPAVGAALVLLLQNLVSSLPTVGERWQLMMGLVFVAFVLVGRGGIAGLVRR